MSSRLRPNRHSSGSSTPDSGNCHCAAIDRHRSRHSISSADSSCGCRCLSDHSLSGSGEHAAYDAPDCNIDVADNIAAGGNAAGGHAAGSGTVAADDIDADDDQLPRPLQQHSEPGLYRAQPVKIESLTLHNSL